MNESFTVKFSYKGKSVAVEDISRGTSASVLLAEARASFNVDDDVILRLIFKGKTIAQDIMDDDDGAVDNDGNNNNHPAFRTGTKIPKGGAKVIVMGSATARGIRHLNSLRSDPLMRGFEDERQSDKNDKATSSSRQLTTFWGPLHGSQDARYKFCRFQECTDASFGSRPGASTPHAFEARRLLERLATDPGIVSVLRSRELVVGTLGEIDPIDDRLVQRKQQEGVCVLGYNTNRGMRIDVKLRTDDLGGFRTYGELASTLVHELSHNWVGEHDVLFWTNYGQMRIEYLWTHARLMRGGVFVNGKRTAALAGVVDMIVSPEGGGNAARNSNDTPTDSQTMDIICQSVIVELAREMAQHHLPVQLVAPAVLAFSKELMIETKDDATLHIGGRRLGTTEVQPSTQNSGNAGTSARELALAAAEKRAREGKDRSS
eukprot:CAMPEP_0181125786 /NCGR_PEP_ID=MMETSP1071-20121207/27249_1 /TAXON_ID=35127 /ORGANISM="Thalassiosira sp., Strain NH16" /LENGTH=431 /DNA_ID=CAMNT_0023211279 /DNA_START=267 /DNA_END=1562 /DNA_ORIENTATION=-